MEFEADYLLNGSIYDVGASFGVDNNMFIFLNGFKKLTNPSGLGPSLIPMLGSLLLLMADL